MNWTDDALEGLRAAEVDLVAYLPDSVVGPLAESAAETDWLETVLVAREEEAVGVLSGAWLGGRRGALVCQTSGLATAFNALGSLSVPWGLPFVGIVDRRGGLGEFNHAQVPAGYGMDDMLDTVGVRNGTLRDGDDVTDRVRLAAETAFDTQQPYVLLAEPTLTGGK
jgi:sulfopyruvate decarboxylase TPP-binding subunit